MYGYVLHVTTHVLAPDARDCRGSDEAAALEAHVPVMCSNTTEGERRNPFCHELESINLRQDQRVYTV